MSEAAGARPVIRIIDGVARVVEDAWAVVEDGTEWDGSAYRLLPLRQALERSQQLRAAAPVGVWLAPSDEPAEAVALFDSIAMIGVRFPKSGDGRGFSTASLLRLRHGWRGGLRALDDVLQDQLFFMRRVGFDSFALRADRDAQQALRAFSTFSDSYQGAITPELPHYRRAGV
jgi:uncharacterized protein (DUF934 family)